METVKNTSQADSSGNIGVEDLRKVACLQHLSDEELNNAAGVIIKFTEIAYEVFCLSNQDAALTPIIKIHSNNAKLKAA